MLFVGEDSQNVLPALCGFVNSRYVSSSTHRTRWTQWMPNALRTGSAE
ncbi:hypothetical protein ACIRRH_15175 [Kitasatospora sp. NPDC101235]